MKRLFIPLDSLEIYDEMHILEVDGSFRVDEKKDGKSTEAHLQDIKFMKECLEKGIKLMPILVKERLDGTFKRLDGFKRCIAYKELGYRNIEAFICSELECDMRKTIPFGNGEMWCGGGGQPKEVFSLFEGTERGKDFDYEKLVFLYKSEDPHGLRIEAHDSIHIHWGKFGKYRLTMGRKDFITLAEAISKVYG